MKDLLSKEHYCHKVHTLLMKSSAYPPCLPPPSLRCMDFLPLSLLYKYGKGSPCEDILGSAHFHKIQLFLKIQFSKMHCLEYCYCLISIIIIIIVIIIIIIMIIILITIIILIITMIIIFYLIISFNDL